MQNIKLTINNKEVEDIKPTGFNVNIHQSGVALNLSFESGSPAIGPLDTSTMTIQ